MDLTTDLLRLGLDPRELQRQLRSGARTRIRRGASRPAGELSPEDEHLELVRATLALTTTPAIVSHLSAAVVHRLPVDRRRLGQVHLVRPGRSHSSTNGLVVRHRQPDVVPVVVNSIPVTPLVATAVDSIRLLPFRDGVAIADQVLRRKVPRDRLLDIVASQPGRTGNRLVRAVVAFADPLAESAGESHARAQFAAAGLPAPQLQRVLTDQRGEMRVDFAWPELRLVAEFDGFVKYGRGLNPTDADLTRVVAAEKAREIRIRRLGWWVVRVVWADLGDPRIVAEVINDGITAAVPLVRLHRAGSAA